MSSPDDLIIRPVLMQDAEALWTIARQEEGELKDEWLMARYR